jgi:hypothetical protein
MHQFGQPRRLRFESVEVGPLHLEPSKHYSGEKEQKASKERLKAVIADYRNRHVSIANEQSEDYEED